MGLTQEMLATTGGRAPGIVVYGGPDCEKTFSLRTLPPPIFMIDTEGGSGNLLPWTRYVMRYTPDGVEQQEITKAQRRASWEMTKKAFEGRGQSNKWKDAAVPGPGPLIDVYYMDPLNPDAYQDAYKLLESFPVETYRSAALDSLMEFAMIAQTFQKGRMTGKKGEVLDPLALTMQETGSWSAAQERAGILLRLFRRLRDHGVVTAVTSGQFIDKEYVTSPFAQKRDDRQEPYSICGGPSAPGRIADEIKHIGDIILHGRSTGIEAVWDREKRPITAGVAQWETKDRFGRLPNMVRPSYYEIMRYIYGDEATNTMYGEAYKEVTLDV